MRFLLWIQVLGRLPRDLSRGRGGIRSLSGDGDARGGSGPRVRCGGSVLRLWAVPYGGGPARGHEGPSVLSRARPTSVRPGRRSVRLVVRLPGLSPRLTSFGPGPVSSDFFPGSGLYQYRSNPDILLIYRCRTDTFYYCVRIVLLLHAPEPNPGGPGRFLRPACFILYHAACELLRAASSVLRVSDMFCIGVFPIECHSIGVSPILYNVSRLLLPMRHKCPDCRWSAKAVPHGSGSSAIYFRVPLAVVYA